MNLLAVNKLNNCNFFINNYVFKSMKNFKQKSSSRSH